MNDNEYKKMFARLTTIFFLAFICSMLCIFVLKKDASSSEVENRELAQKPEFSLKNIENRNFADGYNSYISDQFPLRNFFVSAKSELDMLCGRKESNGVFVGNDNYYIEKFTESGGNDLKDKLKAVNAFKENNRSIKMYCLVAPTSTEIYKDKLPKYADAGDESAYINKIKTGLSKNIKFIDIRESMKKNKNKYIYYKTDHHWTTKGAYLAYCDYCSKVGLKAEDEKDFEIKTVTDDFYGTLYSKALCGKAVPDSIKLYIPKKNDKVVVTYNDEKKKTATMYKSDALNQKNKYEVFTGGNHSLINIKTLSESGKKLLVIKDSYANSFIPFLTSHYSSIDVVDLRYYMDDIQSLIKSDGITDILFLYNASTFNDDNSILNLEN